MAYFDKSFFWTKNEIDLMNEILKREDRELLLSVFGILFYLKPALAEAEQKGTSASVKFIYPSYPTIIRFLKRFMSGKAARKLANLYIDAQSCQFTAFGLRWTIDLKVIDQIAEAIKNIDIDKNILAIGEAYLEKGELASESTI